jgi:apolipoprotein D and lipocalin family protein
MPPSLQCSSIEIKTLPACSAEAHLRTPSNRNACGGIFSALLFCAVLALLTSGCANRQGALKQKACLKTVQHVDLPKYMGDWRVIANIPYFAERGCIDSLESYRLNPDGTIANWFTFRKKSFDSEPGKFTAKIKVLNKETNAEWKVYFFGGLVRAAYLVLDLDPGYQWAVVGHPSRKYGWIMARSKSLPDVTYKAILKRLENQGYDPSLFKKVPQLPEQLGAPGFQ